MIGTLASQLAIFTYHLNPDGGNAEVIVTPATSAAADILDERRAAAVPPASQLEQAGIIVRKLLPATMPMRAYLLPAPCKFTSHQAHVEAILDTNSSKKDRSVFQMALSQNRQLVVAFTDERIHVAIYDILPFPDASDDHVRTFAIFHLKDLEIIDLPTAELPQGILRNGAGTEELVEVFWKQINPRLEDPFANPSDLIDHITFKDESDKPFNEAVTTLLEAYLAIHGLDLAASLPGGKLDAESATLVFEAGCEGSIPRLASGPGQFWLPEALTKAIDICCEDHPFEGQWSFYTMGKDTRFSSYALLSASHFLDVPALPESGHEALEMTERSRGKALTWLRARNFTPTEIEAILGAISPSE